MSYYLKAPLSNLQKSRHIGLTLGVDFSYHVRTNISIRGVLYEELAYIVYIRETRGVHFVLYFAYTCVRDLFVGGVIYLAKKIIR